MGWFRVAQSGPTFAVSRLGSDQSGGSGMRPRQWPVRFGSEARDTLYTDLRALANGFEKINVNDSFQLQHAADLYEPLYQLLYVPLPSIPTPP